MLFLVAPWLDCQLRLSDDFQKGRDWAFSPRILIGHRQPLSLALPRFFPKGKTGEAAATSTPKPLLQAIFRRTHSIAIFWKFQIAQLASGFALISASGKGGSVAPSAQPTKSVH